MKGQKRKSEDLNEVPNTSNKLLKLSSWIDEPINIVNKNEPVVDVDECPCAVASENERNTPEEVCDEEEGIATKYIKDAVDAITIPENDSRAIVEIVTNDLKRALKPLHEQCRILPFGSFVSGLACFGSDLDFYLETSPGSKSPSQVQSLLKSATKALHQSRMFHDVFKIPKARIPIVKFTHKTVECSCDLSFTNEIGVRNTLLVQLYLRLNRHLKPLVLLMKYLLELYDLHGCQKVTTYMLFWLVVYYMQQRDILPPVQSVREIVCEPYIVEGWDCRVPAPYDVPHDSLSLFSHLKAFLKFYSEFSFLKYVISPYLACPISVEDFENLRLPPEFFKVYFDKVQNIEDATFISSAMNVHDPSELNVNITRQVELKVVNQFRSLCYHLFNFFTDDIAEKLATKKLLKDILPPTLPKDYRDLPNDCIQCEIHKLTANRLPANHPLRGTFQINGVFFFANRLETVMKSDYKCDVQTTISDQRIRIRRKGGILDQNVVPAAYFKCQIMNEDEDGGTLPSERDTLKSELIILLDSTFNGEEIQIYFEGKTHLLQRLKCEQIVRSLIQTPE